MQVLFVHTPIPGAPFNSSIAALSAAVQAAGHRSALLTVPPGIPAEQTRPYFSRSNADVVAFSYMTCRAADVPPLHAIAREALPGVRTIVGGAHPTTYPEQTLTELACDALCVGEGEGPFTHWLDKPTTPHAGLLLRDRPISITRWWAPDVDALPDWDRGLFGAVHNDGNRYEQATGVALARGFCPFACTFCGVDGYRRLHKQPRAGASRLRSVKRVLREIRAADQAMENPHGFASWDEVLPSNRDWIRRFFRGYRDQIGKPFACQLRVEQVTEALVTSLVDGGCDYVVLGVETGDEVYRREMLNKPFSNATALTAFARLHDAGIQTFCSFMIGMPFETPAMLAATVRLAEALKPTELSWKYYTPERGTALFSTLEEHDLLIEQYIDHPYGANEAMIRMTHCSQQHLDTAQKALSLLRRANQPRATFEREPERPIQLELRP